MHLRIYESAPLPGKHTWEWNLIANSENCGKGLNKLELYGAQFFTIERRGPFPIYLTTTFTAA